MIHVTDSFAQVFDFGVIKTRSEELITDTAVDLVRGILSLTDMYTYEELKDPEYDNLMKQLVSYGLFFMICENFNILSENFNKLHPAR